MRAPDNKDPYRTNPGRYYAASLHEKTFLYLRCACVPGSAFMRHRSYKSVLASHRCYKVVYDLKIQTDDTQLKPLEQNATD